MVPAKGLETSHSSSHSRHHYQCLVTGPLPTLPGESAHTLTRVPNLYVGENSTTPNYVSSRLQAYIRRRGFDNYFNQFYLLKLEEKGSPLAECHLEWYTHSNIDKYWMWKNLALCFHYQRHFFLMAVYHCQWLHCVSTRHWGNSLKVCSLK